MTNLEYNGEQRPVQAWERRVKKLVTAQEWTMLGICTPNFESELLQELQDYGISGEIIDTGCVEWNAKLTDSYKLILGLRTANRILLRLATFHAGAREELFRKTANIPWELWLDKSTKIRCQAKVVKSRVSHEGYAAETCTEAVYRRLNEQGLCIAQEKSSHSDAELTLDPVRILLRIIENKVSISLDASGILHYRRGYRLSQVLAPLRESLAAGLLLWARVADYTSICDPFCGSGTFAIEAASILSQSAAGLARSFACDKWPGISAASKRHIRKNAYMHGTHAFQHAMVTKHSSHINVYASDIDSAAIACARINQDRAWQWCNQSMRDSMNFLVQEKDFFSMLPPSIHSNSLTSELSTGLVCMNPPYGIRLTTTNNEVVESFYRALADRLYTHWSGWKKLLIVPEASFTRFFPASAQRKRFRNGGLDLIALCWNNNY